MPLGEAAKAAGKSKPTIARAIKRSVISAAKTADGSYEIDPSELARVFPLFRNGAGTMKQSVPPVSLAELLAERDRLVEEQGKRFAICAPGSMRAKRNAVPATKSVVWYSHN
jgi:hypothetical protein